MFTRLTNRTKGYFVAGMLAVFAMGTTSAQANNYQSILKSTAWIITKDAENNTSTGTGVLIDDERRLVVTNSHVVGQSRNVVVFFPEIDDGLPKNERKYYLKKVLKLGLPSKVISVDPKRDLALIELPKIPDGIEAMEMATKSQLPGSKVDIVGNPGSGNVLWVYTSGTVRSLYQKKFRSSYGEHDFRVLETQTPIKQGDSGAPVVNAEGTLIGLVQSFSPTEQSVSYCVDVSEIKAFLNTSWKPAPVPTKSLLQQADLEHSVHASGHYQVVKDIKGDRKQTVFVAKNTEYYQLADIRKVWSLAITTKDPPTAETMMRVLRQSAATKIGSWAIEKTQDDQYMLIFVAKLDATASHHALEATIDYVARLTDGLEKDLNVKEEDKTASQTLANWLAD